MKKAILHKANHQHSQAAMNNRELQECLDHLLEAEKHIDIIQRKGGFQPEHPQCFDVLEQIRSRINVAYIKINEGDHMQ